MSVPKIYLHGTRWWYKNGKTHRNDGPAIEFCIDGLRSWWENGKRHRSDGPAVEWANGSRAWYNDDIRIKYERA
jgi:hypothetical protein